MHPGTHTHIHAPSPHSTGVVEPHIGVEAEIVGAVVLLPAAAAAAGMLAVTAAIHWWFAVE